MDCSCILPFSEIGQDKRVRNDSILKEREKNMYILNIKILTIVVLYGKKNSFTIHVHVWIFNFINLTILKLNLNNNSAFTVHVFPCISIKSKVYLCNAFPQCYSKWHWNLFSSTVAFHISVECTCISNGLLELSVAFVISWTVGFSQGLAQPEVFHP